MAKINTIWDLKMHKGISPLAIIEIVVFSVLYIATFELVKNHTKVVIYPYINAGIIKSGLL